MPTVEELLLRIPVEFDSTKIKVGDTALKSLNQSAKESSPAMDKLSAASQQLLSSFQKLAAPADVLANHMHELEGAGASLTDVLRVYGKELTDVANAQEAAGKPLNALAGTYRMLASDAIPPATQQTSGFATSLTNLTTGMFAAISAQRLLEAGLRMLKDAFVDSIKQAAAAEASIMRLQFASRQTGQSFDLLSKAAHNLASTGMVDAEETMERLADLTQRGFSTEQAEKFLGSLRDISIVARSSGETVSQSMQRITEAMLSGRATGAEFAKIFPSMKTEMHAAGLTLQDFNDETKQGQVIQVLMAVAAKDSAAATGVLGVAMQGAHNQSESLTIAINDLKEAFGTGLLNSLKDVGVGANGLAETFRNLTKFAEEFGNKVIWLAANALPALAIQLGILKAAADAINEIGFAIRLRDIGERSGAGLSAEAAAVGDNQKLITDMYIKFHKEQLNEELAFTAQRDLVITQRLQAEYDANSGATQKIRDTAVKKVQELRNLEKGLNAAIVNEQKQAADNLNAEAKAALEKHLAEVKKVSEAELTAWQSIFAAIETAEMKSLNARITEMTNFSQGFATLNSKIAADAIKIGQAFSDEASAGIDAFANNFLMMNKQIGDSAANIGGEIETEMRDKMVASFRTIAAGLGTLAGEFDGFFGTVLSAAASFADAFAFLMEETGSKSQAAIGGAFAAGGSLAASFAKSDEAKKGAQIGSVVGGIAGSFFGPLGTVIGSALGKAVGAFIGSLFAHDWAKDVKKFVDQMGFAVSEGLSKKLAEAAKAVGDAGSAVVLNLGEVINEVGISMATLPGILQTLQYAFEAVKKGFIETSDAMKAWSDTLPQIVGFAINTFKRITPEIRALVETAKAAGIEIPAFGEFLQEQIEKLNSAMGELTQTFGTQLDDLLKRLQGQREGKGGTEWLISQREIQDLENDFNSLAMIAVASFNQMIDAGFSTRDAMAAIAPTLAQLKIAWKEFGLGQDNPAIKALINQFKLLEKFKAPLSELDAMLSAMEALAAMGNLTQKGFDTMQSSMRNSFREIVRGGGASRQELIAMKPELVRMAQLARDYGFSLDPVIQHYIDIATKQGIISEKDFAPSMEESMATLNQVLIDLNNTLLAFVANLTGIPATINTTVTTTYVDKGKKPPWLGGGEYNPEDLKELPPNYLTGGPNLYSGSANNSSMQTVADVVRQQSRQMFQTVVTISETTSRTMRNFASATDSTMTEFGEQISDDIKAMRYDFATGTAEQQAIWAKYRDIYGPWNDYWKFPERGGWPEGSPPLRPAPTPPPTTNGKEGKKEVHIHLHGIENGRQLRNEIIRLQQQGEL